MIPKTIDLFQLPVPPDGVTRCRVTRYMTYICPHCGREHQIDDWPAALALYDPSAEQWNEAGAPIAAQLVAVNPLFLATWMESLRPVKEKLIEPLALSFRDRSAGLAAERMLATNILADYAATEPTVLADLLMDADEKQFTVLFSVLQRARDVPAGLFERELARQIAGIVSEADKDALAKRQANAGIALVRLERPLLFWPLLKHIPDPRVRSYLIAQLGPMGVEPKIILGRLPVESDVSIRRALLLILGELGPDKFALAEREQMLLAAQQIYRDDPDPGLHGASAWLLGRLNQPARLTEIDNQLATGHVEGNRGWYVNGQGQTMAIVRGPIEYVRGSPPSEEGREGGRDGTTEAQRPTRIPRSFAIAAREVTVAQFLRFRANHPVNKQYAPTADCPVNRVSWYDAAAYCNWLSEREGVPADQWCYLPNERGQFAEGMKLAPDYLSRTGYRLPSEAEWEFACRAGAATSRYYGESEELLANYAWSIRDSRQRWTLPVGSLQPNDFGLFDMLGNAWEWCQERYTDDATGTDDREDARNPRDNEGRVLRGGSPYRVVSIRCADRDKEQPANRDNYIGLRPARTMR